MNLPKFSLEHKPIVLGIALVMLLWGLYTFLNAPRREDPEFTIREALVVTDWPGATADQIEVLVTDKVEKAAANLKQVRRVQSWSYPERSVVQVSAVNEVKDVRSVWTKLRAELRLLRSDLPQNAYPPIVDDNFGDTAALILALYQDPEKAGTQPYTPRELEIFAKKLRDRLMDLRPTEERPDGRKVPLTTEPAYVARLDLYGVQPEVIYLETDAGIWSQLRLTSSELKQILSERNVVAPAGILNTTQHRISTHLSGSFDAVEDIRGAVIDRIATGTTASAASLASMAANGGRGTGSNGVSLDIPVNLENLNIRVRRDYADPPLSLVRYADTGFSAPSIVLSFTMKPGQNIAWLGEAVDGLLNIANETFLPPDIIIQKVSDPPKFVQKKVSDVISNLIQAIALVLLILGLLAGIRVALVTAMSIPLIMLTSVALMRIWNVEIEQISLAALIVALGLLVDNAIVTCENTSHFLNQGMARKDAVIQGCNLVGGSLLWSSFTTIGVFIPMAFALPGDMGEYVFSLPVVVTLTLLVSWLCAMTVTPILNYYILKPSEGGLPVVRLVRRLTGKSATAGETTALDSKTPQKSEKGWFNTLSRWAIRLRFVTIGGAFVLLFGSLLLPVKPSFFPDSDRPQFIVDVWLPEYASIHSTDQAARQVEALVRRLSYTTWTDGGWAPAVNDKGDPIKRLANMVTYVGIGGPRFYTGLDPGPNAPNYAALLINASNPAVVDDYVADIRRAAWTGIDKTGDKEHLAPIAGARVVPHKLVLGTPVAAPIQYRLTGPRLADEALLRHYSNQLKDILRDSQGAWDVSDSWGTYGFQLDVEVDPVHANLAGVTNNTFAHTLNTYYSGLHLTRYREGDREIPIMLRLPEGQRQSLHGVRTAFVEGYDRKVPLDSVAKVAIEHTPSVITRYQRERSVWVQARPEPGILAREVLEQIKPEVSALEDQMPPGYRIEYGGIQEEAERGERANSVALSIGIMLVILCLVLQYNSSVKPLLILLTVPLSVIGGMLGLWLRGIPLGFMETLGFLALFGTVLNAAILMIDFTEQLIKEKLGQADMLAPEGERAYCGLRKAVFRDTLTEASQARMMPIFMTTATTVAGLASLMFGGGPLFKGLATVFAVGLIIGSTITLFVLPALIALFVENFRYTLVRTDKS